MRTLLVIGAALAAVGCTNDPCDGKPGVCVALRVEGSVSGLDQLSVTVDQPTMETRDTPIAPFSLPVQIALSLPAGTSGPVAIGVIGRASGNAVAQGATSVVLSGTRGKATVTLSGGTIGDGGDIDMTGGGSTDMAGCGMVTACMAGDGCCPASCDATSDSDCPSVCGNGVVEPGEVCDDHNTTSGDGCDATCRWHETLDKISGNPGATGHADDSGGYARLSQPSGVTADATNNRLYIASSFDCTIRQADNATSPTVTALVGKPWSCMFTDGPFASAGFNDPTDIEFLGGNLYVVDNINAAIRKIDLTAKTVATIVQTSVQGIGHFGTKLVFFDLSGGATGGLKTYDPSTNMVAIAAPLANFTSSVVQSQNCFDVACDAANCYVACGGSIGKVVMSSGAVTNYAGSFAGGAWSTGCTDGATANSSAKFTLAFKIAIDAAGNLFTTDINCNNVEKITTTTTNRFAGSLGSAGFGDGMPLTQAFFRNPAGITSIGTDYFVADHDNDSIRWIGANATQAVDVFTIVGYPHNYADSTFVTTPPVATPNYGNGFTGIASDGINEYAVDSTGRILKIAVASGAASLLVPATAWGLSGASFTSLVRVGNTLFTTASNGTIMCVGVDGTNPILYAGTPNPTVPPSDGSRLSAVMYPNFLATDGTNLYFADSGKLIRSIDTAGMVHTLAGNYTATDVTDGTGTAAHMLRASWLTTEGKFVFFADTSQINQGGPPPGALRRLELATGKVDTVAGSASMNGHVDGAGGTARFSGITGLATDGLSVFVGDSDNYNEQPLVIAPVIRQLVLSTMSVSTNVGTVGQQTFKPGVATAARVHAPAFLTFDATTHALLFFDAAEYVFGRIK